MAKYLGYSANSSWLRYIRDNADVMYLTLNAATTPTAGSIVVSANISAADFTIASAAAGAVMTIGAKNNQTIEGSGNVTHIYLGTASASRCLLYSTVSSQILASGNTVNIASWTVTALASANNS